MMHPLHDQASHTVLHAWITLYLRGRDMGAGAGRATVSPSLHDQAQRLRESAVQLQLALEKMRIANEKLALRMAEHKAFFAKYQTPQKYRTQD